MIPFLRIAVITPYFETPDEWLRQCHESVRQQTHPCTHLMLADGKPQACADAFDAQHFVLPKGHADYGDTPRAIGSMSAAGQGFDAITYLDADNWFAPDHVASLVALHQQTGAAICTSMRSFHDLEGRQMAVCLSSDGDVFSDTSCIMLFRPAFHLTSIWALMHPEDHAIDDRVVWHHIRQSGLPRAHSGKATVAYRVNHAGIYRDLSQPVPPGVKDGRAIGGALQKWEARGNPPLKVVWRYAVPRRPKPEATSP